MYAREKQSRCCGHIDQLYEFMQNAAVHRSYLILGKHNQNPRNYLRWSFETMVKDKKLFLRLFICLRETWIRLWSLKPEKYWFQPANFVFTPNLEKKSI